MTDSQQPAIFINYRRPGGRHLASLLKRELERHFGSNTVFLDNTSIESGSSWEEQIEGALKAAKVLIAIVHGEGLEWFTVTEGEYDDKRLFQDDDWVRKEIRLSLLDKKCIIPIKERAVTWPKPEKAHKAVPNDIQAFLKLHYLEYNGDDVQNSFEKLLKRIQKELPELKPIQRDGKVVVEKPNPLLHLPLSPTLQEGFCFLDDPYLGPVHFEEKHASLFFGREDDIREVYDIIQELKPKQVLLLHGASGVGKSSLLHAGLFPRMKHQDWHVEYVRRDKAIGFVQQLMQHTEKALQSQQKDKLLLLDQVEEIVADEANKEEWTGFFKQLREILDAHLQIKIVLCFRKEYLADVRDALKEYLILNKLQSVKSLNERGVRAAINGVFENRDIKNHFNLDDLDKKFENALTNDILKDKTSNVAPLLQYQLRTIWEKAKQKADGGKIKFKPDFYEPKVSLKQFLETEKLAKIEAAYPEEATNGLLNDILNFYTTEDVNVTAATRSQERYFERYRHIEEDKLLGIHTMLVAEYILFFNDEHKQQSRLAHDSLAKIVRQRFEEAQLPGQRAWALVKVKSKEIEKQDKKLFSEADLQIIKAGINGMPALDASFKAKMRAEEQAYFDVKKERFELFISNAQSNYEHLDFKTCLKELALARAENFDNDALLTLAQELICPLGLLGWEDEVEACKGLISDLGGDLLKGEKANEIQERFLPKMLEIQGGTFKMGDTKGDFSKQGYFPAENPVHKVSVSDFRLGETPITCWQYGLYCLSVGKKLPNDSGFGRGDRPVINVSWHEAAAYCNWLSTYYKLAPFYQIEHDKVAGEAWGNNGFRLPTEAEWEYAASEGGQYRFGNGKDVASYEGLNYDVQHEYNQQHGSKFTEVTEEASQGQTTPVKQYEPNGLVLYDMSGNVNEWCQDWYDEAYYKTLGDEVEDPLGPKSSPEGEKTIRGGSWYGPSLNCRCASRRRDIPIYRNVNVGFRVSGR